jgi:hypothetical protein
MCLHYVSFIFTKIYNLNKWFIKRLSVSQSIVSRAYKLNIRQFSFNYIRLLIVFITMFTD